jgi:hypothetical protein
LNLRNSVNTLYEAMQNLLGNLHLPEVPLPEGHDSAAASSDDEDEEGEAPQVRRPPHHHHR